MELEQIRELALANGFKLNELTPNFYDFAKALLAASMAYGDGYYDGFIAGAKHQEDNDLNTASHHLTDAALLHSEDAEDKREKGLSVRRKVLQKTAIGSACARILKVSEQHDVEKFDAPYNWLARCIADGRDSYFHTQKLD